MAAAAVWACGAATLVGIAYQGNAEAEVPADALQCNDGDFVMSTIFEPVLEIPGEATPREALEALRSEYAAEDVAGLQPVDHAADRATFARSEHGRQGFVAKLVNDNGWRLESAAACVANPRGGRS